MRVNIIMTIKPLKIFVKAVAFLCISTVLSCSETSTNDVLPQAILNADQYSLEVSKTLYSSIKLNNYNLKKTKENFIFNINNHNNDIVRNTANSLSNDERFNGLFSYKSEASANARIATEEVGGLNLENIKSEINSPGLTSNIKNRIVQLGDKLSTLKAQLNQSSVSEPTTVKNEIDKVIANFEGDIMNDSSLSLDEKTKLFSFTIATRDNLENVKQLLTGTNSGGRKGCFFCNIVNIFVTIVVAVAVVAVAAVVIVAAASILIEGTVAALQS